MFRFLYAADIHLDSPLRGLYRYEGAPHEEIRQASRRALANLVQLACLGVAVPVQSFGTQAVLNDLSAAYPSALSCKLTPECLLSPRPDY
jgi:hypothetical protein